MQAQAMADQARATAARERIMAQVGSFCASKSKGNLGPSPNWPLSSPTPSAKSPKNTVSAPERVLPAKALHAIPDPHYGAASRAESQSPLRHESLAASQRETLYAGRVHVRITSYRRRLLDPDNLTAKWFLDACRYARLIRDDKPEDITYQVGQEKVARKEDERTEIIIEPLPTPPEF